MNKFRFIILSTILTLLIFHGCAKRRSPLDILRADLRGVPTYSVILEDMKEEGTFFKSYYHKYKILIKDMILEGEIDSTETGWEEVPKDFFKRHLPFLGMTIWVKKNGKESVTAGPAGYEYVGNSQYGRWNRDSSGRSFWVFYGQYRLLTDILGPRPIYRGHYNTYNTYRSQNRPYYGPNKEYGTNGSLTKRQKPNFYSRRTSRDMVKKASFSQRVNKRIGRTRTSARGRGGRAGK